MATNRSLEMIVSATYPNTMKHLQQLIMDAEACAKNYGKKTLFGKDKFESSADKFMLTIKLCVSALVADNQLENDQDAMEALDLALSRCEVTYSSWPLAFKFWHEWYLQFRNKLVRGVNITAHILDPNTGYTQQTWTVGQHVQQEVVEKLSENGNLFVVVHYEAGIPKQIICKHEVWNQTKAQHDLIDSTGQGSIQRTMDGGNKKPQNVNHSSIEWNLVADWINKSNVYLIGSKRTIEVDEAVFCGMLVIAKINGWAGGNDLFIIKNNHGILRQLEDGMGIFGDEASELGIKYFEFKKEQGGGMVQENLAEDFLKVCIEGGFTVETTGRLG